jgi:hypothetical protein
MHNMLKSHFLSGVYLSVSLSSIQIVILRPLPCAKVSKRQIAKRALSHRSKTCEPKSKCSRRNPLSRASPGLRVTYSNIERYCRTRRNKKPIKNAPVVNLCVVAVECLMKSEKYGVFPSPFLVVLLKLSRSETASPVHSSESGDIARPTPPHVQALCSCAAFVEPAR